MITLDASVLIAHLNPADPHHATATEILLAGSAGEMLVHSITLAEVLVGGVRIGQGASMHADLQAAGISALKEVQAAQHQARPLGVRDEGRGPHVAVEREQGKDGDDGHEGHGPERAHQNPPV